MITQRFWGCKFSIRRKNSAQPGRYINLRPQMCLDTQKNMVLICIHSRPVKSGAVHGKKPGKVDPAEIFAGRNWAIVMNISETVDTIIELRNQGAAPDEKVAEYLKATLWAADAHVQVQRIFYSPHSRSLVVAAAFVLCAVFLVSLLKRRHRAAFISALAIPLILFLEFSLDLHLVSWPIQKKSENIVAQFPVQDAARRVIVGTHYADSKTAASDRLAETVSAFLLPITLVITLLGLWQVAMYFGKFDFEDAHTIALIMGSVCAIYYALAFGVFSNGAAPLRKATDPEHNAGSIAALAALAEDLSQKYPRLQNTWVTVAFFGRGGPEGLGAVSFAGKLARERDRALATYFIGCEHLGRGGSHGYVLPDMAAMAPLYADRELLRTLNRAAVITTGRQLGITRGTMTNSKGFVEYGFPTVSITTTPPEGNPGSRRIDRGQLLLSLQLLETCLSEFETGRLR